MTQAEALLEIDFAAPIPLELPDITGWKEIPVHEGGVPLVALGAFSGYDDIFTSSVYAGEHSNSPYWSADRQLKGSLTTQFVRQEVADQLRVAQKLLPKNHYLIVFDSYRTLKVQSALYDHYLGELTSQHPDWSAEQLSTETQRYVSVPSHDPSRPSPHNTGGAVDLAIFTLPDEEAERLRQTEARIKELRAHAPQVFSSEEEAANPVLRELYLQEMTKQGIIRRYGQFLNFGTAFDHGGEAAGTNYLERAAQTRELDESEKEGLKNRRLLFNVMRSVGMESYPDEWWHFNSPKSQMGAKAAGLDHGEYGAVDLSAENKEHETMRAMHRKGLVRIQEARMTGQQYVASGALQELIELNETALDRVGDPRIGIELGEVEVIEPPESNQV